MVRVGNGMAKHDEHSRGRLDTKLDAGGRKGLRMGGPLNTLPVNPGLPPDFS